MGSSGSGSFSDYSQVKPKDNTSKTGGSSGEDNCLKAFSTELEDVGRCAYYINNGTVPPVGTEVEIYFNRRLIARTLRNEDIGYLPTKLNFLKPCIDSGYQYSGVVDSSSNLVLPIVRIDITPSV